jgi:archaellum component FlaC
MRVTFEYIWRIIVIAALITIALELRTLNRSLVVAHQDLASDVENIESNVSEIKDQADMIESDASEMADYFTPGKRSR